MIATTGVLPTNPPELSKHCRIVNPLPSTPATIRRRSARRAVRAGRAAWVNVQGNRIGVESDAIALLDRAAADHQQHLADAWLWAQRAKNATGRTYDDIIRPMTLRENRGIPMRSGDPTNPPVSRA
jgi:hypothetical protein